MIQEAKENKKNVQRGAQFIISFCGCVFFSRLWNTFWSCLFYLWILFLNILLQKKGMMSMKKMIRNLLFKMPKQRKKNVENG